MNRLLNDGELAKMLGMSVQTIRNKRSRGDDFIPYVKLTSRAIRYRIEDIEEYLEERKIFPGEN